MNHHTDLQQQPTLSTKLMFEQQINELLAQKIELIDAEIEQMIQHICNVKDVKGEHHSDSSPMSVDESENIFYETLEAKNRSLYVLQQFKIALSKKNAALILRLLHNNHYTKSSSEQYIRKVLGISA